MIITGPHIILDSENPKGVVDAPTDVEQYSEGFLLIILDGVGRDFLLDENLMPSINSFRGGVATSNLTTGPLTLSATCVGEMMTGVPNSPIDGLKNFNLKHPGGEDPWTLAAKDERYSVGMIGSYVMGNMYDGMEGIEFVNTFQGHADYYEGDNDTYDLLKKWLENGRNNVISAHFSGPDKVGHKWGTKSYEYEQKMRYLDSIMYSILQKVSENWTVVITADHGMTDIGSHGSSEDETRDVAAIISGPVIKPGVENSGYQSDIAALMPAVLNLPFPIQLHGKIPLEILNITEEQRNSLEQWNWDAASQRQIFIDGLNGIESSQNDYAEIDWSKISANSVFSRNIDHTISIVCWIIMAMLTINALGKKTYNKKQDKIFIIVYCSALTGFIASHAALSYSAMIPRGIGALCAAWIVAWSLGSKSNISASKVISKSKFEWFISLLTDPRILPVIILILFILLGTITEAIVISCMAWVVIFSVGNKWGIAERFTGNLPSFAPWLMAFATFTFGSIRLWFTLIPLLFIFISKTSNLIKSESKLSEKIPMIATTMLIFLAVTLVHRRIFGRHFILDLVRMGWPDNTIDGIFSANLLIIATLVAVPSYYKEFSNKTIAIFSAWLLTGFLILAIDLAILEIAYLIAIIIAYTLSFLSHIGKINLNYSEGLFLAALSAHILVTWGAWSASITMILISAMRHIVKHVMKDFDLSKTTVTNPKPIIAMAVLPWAIWILWWTLLGQVNGIQTCFEGICPHPRELDPGTIIVKGGYFASIGNPSTIWMSLMISLTVIIAATAIMYEIKKHGIVLKPYLTSQLFVILGCMCLLAFSPEYPRLVFGLTWNITFAALQIIVALCAAFAYKITTSYELTVSE